MTAEGLDFWRRDDPAGTVEAIKLAGGPSQAVLVCRSGTSWVALQQTWARRREIGETTDEVHLLYAVYPAPPAALRTVRAAVATALGFARRPAAIAEPWPGAFLWEITAEPVRLLVLVGPQQARQSLERWIWPAGRTRAAPLPAFLWQAARLRHERSVLEADRPGMRDRQARLRGDVAELRGKVAGLVEAGPATRTALSPEIDLLRLQWATALVAADEAWLRARAVTVAAVRSELDQADPDRRGRDSGPLADDLDLGRWLALEIADLADGARTAVAFAEPVTRAARANDDRLARDLTERTQYLVAVQGAAIGALLVVLTTVQSLQYPWPAAVYLKLPVTVVLGLLALVLPVWAATRPTGAAPDRRTPRWLAAPAAAAAAAIAWLAITAISDLVTTHPAPPWLTGPIAGVVLAGVAVLLLARREGGDGRPRSAVPGWRLRRPR